MVRAVTTELKGIHEAVLNVLSKMSKPMSAYEILAGINKSKKDKLYAPPQAYRALKFLTDKKLVHRLETQNAYVICKHDAHAHHQTHTCTHDKAVQFLVCSKCSRTAEIEIPAALKTITQAATRIGFTITLPVIELVGICSQCK
jgi:Fur family zinc uptake transcriptional regulator